MLETTELVRLLDAFAIVAGILLLVSMMRLVLIYRSDIVIVTTVLYKNLQIARMCFYKHTYFATLAFRHFSQNE